MSYRRINLLNDMNNIFQFPAIYALDERYKGNIIQQIILPSYSSEVVTERYSDHRTKGYLLTPTHKDTEKILVIANTAQPPEGFRKVLRLRLRGQIEDSAAPIDSSHVKWLRHTSSGNCVLV